MRPSESSSSMSSLFENFKQTQSEVKRSNQIVIIGGGSVGVEMAGEIRAVYPDKKITLVHNSPHLLHPKSTPAPGSNDEPTSYSAPPTVVKLSIALEKQLKEINVDLILDDRVEVPRRGARLGEGHWDGTFGPLDGVKTVKTSKGQSLSGASSSPRSLLTPQPTTSSSQSGTNPTRLSLPLLSHPLSMTKDSSKSTTECELKACQRVISQRVIAQM